MSGMTFSQKRVSKNAVITLAIGIISVLGFIILFLLAAFSGGDLPLAGGLVGALLMLLSVFGVLWGLLSYDDIRTVQRFKISGILINVFVIIIGISLLML